MRRTIHQLGGKLQPSIDRRPPLVPVGRLLERVSCTQHKRLFHVPANNLEADGKPIACLPAGQRQRRMAAHVERRREAQTRFDYATA